MELRLALAHEAQTAMELIESARAHLREQGLDQWQSGYPDIDCIRQDIARQKGYFALNDGQIIGYICIDFDGEPAYDAIDGAWATGVPYMALHRLAFSAAHRGKGLGGGVFPLAEEIARKKGVRFARVDTHPGNRKMQRILERQGFARRGIVWYDEGSRIAYDKTIGGTEI